MLCHYVEMPVYAGGIRWIVNHKETTGEMEHIDIMNIIVLLKNHWHVYHACFFFVQPKQFSQLIAKIHFQWSVICCRVLFLGSAELRR